jgi:hypothetical protein
LWMRWRTIQGALERSRRIRRWKKAGCEPVGGDGGKDGEERFGEGGDNVGRGGIVYRVGVEEGV